MEISESLDFKYNRKDLVVKRDKFIKKSFLWFRENNSDSLLSDIWVYLLLDYLECERALQKGVFNKSNFFLTRRFLTKTEKSKNLSRNYLYRLLYPVFYRFRRNKFFETAVTSKEMIRKSKFVAVSNDPVLSKSFRSDLAVSYTPIWAFFPNNFGIESLENHDEIRMWKTSNTGLGEYFNFLANHGLFDDIYKDFLLSSYFDSLARFKLIYNLISAHLDPFIEKSDIECLGMSSQGIFVNRILGKILKKYDRKVTVAEHGSGVNSHSHSFVPFIDWKYCDTYACFNSYTQRMYESRMCDIRNEFGVDMQMVFVV